MKTILLLSALSLVSCSGIRTQLNETEVKQISRLQTRCEIESGEIYKTEDEKLMPVYCRCMLTSLADPKILNTQGTEAALKRLNDYYKMSVDLSRAIMSEDQDRVNRFPKEMILATGRQMDKCLDQAKSHFYEKEMDERITAKLGE